MSRRVAFRKRKQNRLAMLSITIVVAMLLTVVSINSWCLREKQNSYIEQEEALQKQIDEQDQRTQDLEELKKYTQTKKYAEEVAKDKLGMVYNDEIVFKSDN